MKIIISKKAKKKKNGKKKLKRYWGTLYPKEYADLMVAKKVNSN
tara:strand:+ start:914 stop:1045 length:132 start_codon:yes stop_codon:yes gene_type:complete